jgi:hypothetical protein
VPVDQLARHGSGATRRIHVLGIDARLLKWLTAQPARNELADFEKRLLSTDPDTEPLAMIGGMLQPVNAGAWYFNREIAVLAALRDHIGSHEQGKAYEAALVHVVKAVGPPDVTASSDRHIGPPGKTGKKGHEVDLVISGEDLLIVGEAKAKIAASQARGVASSYEDQLLESVRQIQVRLGALEAGQVVLGSPPAAVDVSHRWGLCVPLHDYGGTAWRADALARFFTSSPCAVMPAHGFALAMSCLRNAGEVSGYLRMRLSLSNGLVAGLDELEPLLGWIHGDYSWPHLLSFPPFRVRAINTTVDAAVEVLSAHHVSPARLQTLATDPTDAEWSQSALSPARMLLGQAP